MDGCAVGIDLGTTNSCVAVFRNGRVDVIENSRGFRTTPSWVTFTETGVLTGIESVEESHKYPKTTVFEAKRLMGQQFKDPNVQADIKRFPYTVFDDLGTPKIKIDETKTYYPEEISAYILRDLRQFAEARLNKEVTKAVVTVPAYFNEAQRQATKDAAAIAGFEKITVINEPTAAAVAFNHENRKNYKRNLLVYDFGGGTFDVSVVTVDKTKSEVRATNGDCHLGGTDIDMNLVEFLKKEIGEDYNQGADDEQTKSRRLKNICEAAKKKLSTKYNVDIELDAFSTKDFSNFPLSRARFEQLNANLFQRTIQILDECLRHSGVAKDCIDEVILVGGSSRIPKVQEMLKNYFGTDIINKGVNPDEAVAYGAAIHATNLAGNKNEVVDVTALSLGTNTYGDLFSVIIPRNTPIPAKSIKRYQTIMDNQTSMEFPIYQGEREIASENFELGNFAMTDLTEAPAKAVKVEVCYYIDYEGLLTISATEINSGNRKDVCIDMKKKGLSDQQIQERILEAEENKQNDIKRRKFAEAKYALESLLGNTREHADKCIQEDKDKLYDAHDSIYKWLEKAKLEDLEKFEGYTKELKDLIANASIDSD